MSNEEAAENPQNHCDHAWAHHHPANSPIWIPVCQLCGAFGVDDIREQIGKLTDTRTSGEVEADFQGRHNRENLGNVIGWVVVPQADAGEVDFPIVDFYTSRKKAEAAIYDYVPSEFRVFPVVRTL